MKERREPREILVGDLELALRCADERDASFCYELMNHNMKDLFDRNTKEKWSRAKFRSGFDPDRITIVEHEGMSVGFFDYEMVGEEVYWHNLQMSEDYQSGAGTKIVKLMEQTARDNGAKVIFGKVFSENLKAIRWLQKHGYKIDKKIEQENSYWVRKDLGAAQ